MQENNANDFTGDFDRLKEQWEKLSKEQKTPAYFKSLFSVESGGFENTAELKAVYPQIEKLIAEQGWKQADADTLKVNFIQTIQPELKKDFTPYTVESFISDVKAFDPSKEYEPAGMKDIIFQHGTFNLIAARPSRGKTTLAVSLLLDAIENANLARNNTPAVFLTFEESNKQIYTRIFNNLLFASARKANAVSQIATNRPRLQLWNILKDPNNPDFEGRTYYVESVKQKILELEKSGRLQVIDFAGKNINAIENLLTFNKNAVVFIDYVQLIRPDPTKTGFNTLDGYNDISKRLADAAKANNQIIIGAAQLRRLSEGASDTDNPENLNDTQLKDCGQFEQDANTIIALGRNTAHRDTEKPEHDKGEPFYFWKLLKNRDGGGVNKSYLFDTSNLSIAFSFLQSTETDAAFLNKADKAKKEKEGNERKNTNKKSYEMPNDDGYLAVADSGASAVQYGNANKAVQYRIDHTNRNKQWDNFSYRGEK